MEFVPSTVLSLLAIVALLAAGPRRGAWLVMAAAPFGAAAAVNLPAVGGASILMLDLMALALFVQVALSPRGPQHLLGTARLGQPGFWLLLLVLFGLLSGLFFPRVFSGQTEVFSITRPEGRSRIILSPLQPGTGNLTQMFRLGLGMVVFFAFATAFRRGPRADLVLRAMIAATVVHVTLGWADVILHAVGLSEVLDLIRSANYAILSESRMGGLKRMIGGFPEASAYGYFTLALFGFWLQYWLSGGRSRLGLWMLIATVVVLLRCTSSSAYVAAALFVLSLAGIAFVGRLRRTIPRRAAGIMAIGLVMVWIGAITLIGAYQMVDPFAAYMDGALFDKLEGDSGIERMGWNEQAWRNFVETGFMGAGLGSIRASNWLLACLGSLGLIGTGLFLAFLASVAAQAEAGGDPERGVVVRGLKAGCLAQFCTALLIVPTPDLGITFFALAGLAAGLARGGFLAARRGN